MFAGSTTPERRRRLLQRGYRFGRSLSPGDAASSSDEEELTPRHLNVDANRLLLEFDSAMDNREQGLSDEWSGTDEDFMEGGQPVDWPEEKEMHGLVYDTISNAYDYNIQNCIRKYDTINYSPGPTHGRLTSFISTSWAKKKRCLKFDFEVYRRTFPTGIFRLLHRDEEYIRRVQEPLPTPYLSAHREGDNRKCPFVCCDDNNRIAVYGKHDTTWRNSLTNPWTTRPYILDDNEYDAVPYPHLHLHYHLRLWGHGSGYTTNALYTAAEDEDNIAINELVWANEMMGMLIQDETRGGKDGWNHVMLFLTPTEQAVYASVFTIKPYDQWQFPLDEENTTYHEQLMNFYGAAAPIPPPTSAQPKLTLFTNGEPDGVRRAVFTFAGLESTRMPYVNGPYDELLVNCSIKGDNYGGILGYEQKWSYILHSKTIRGGWVDGARRVFTKMHVFGAVEVSNFCNFLFKQRMDEVEFLRTTYKFEPNYVLKKLATKFDLINYTSGAGLRVEQITTFQDLVCHRLAKAIKEAARRRGDAAVTIFAQKDDAARLMGQAAHVQECIKYDKAVVDLYDFIYIIKNPETITHYTICEWFDRQARHYLGATFLEVQMELARGDCHLRDALLDVQTWLLRAVFGDSWLKKSSSVTVFAHQLAKNLYLDLDATYCFLQRNYYQRSPACDCPVVLSQKAERAFHRSLELTASATARNQSNRELADGRMKSAEVQKEEYARRLRVLGGESMYAYVRPNGNGLPVCLASVYHRYQEEVEAPAIQGCPCDPQLFFCI